MSLLPFISPILTTLSAPKSLFQFTERWAVGAISRKVGILRAYKHAKYASNYMPPIEPSNQGIQDPHEKYGQRKRGNKTSICFHTSWVLPDQNSRKHPGAKPVKVRQPNHRNQTLAKMRLAIRASRPLKQLYAESIENISFLANIGTPAGVEI